MPAIKISRRRLLAGASGAALVGQLPAPAEARPRLARGGKAGVVGGGPLQITLTFTGGATASFSEASATDIGTYTGAFVQQRCKRQIASGYGDFRDSFHVDFRPDVSGTRDEIVVEFGTLHNIPGGATQPTLVSGRPPQHIFNPYTATISGGTLGSTAIVNVPNHWHRARWRWQSAPRPLVRTYQDIIDAKLALPLSATYAISAENYSAKHWEGPMGIGPLYTYFPAAGGRPDLGFITDWMAEWVMTGTSVAEGNWRAVAEATGTMDFWVRDAATGGLVDLDEKPYLAWQNAFFDDRYQIPLASTVPNVTPNYFWLDTSHMPPLALVAYMLTDDPYYLEGAQAVVNYHSMQSNIGQINSGRPLRLADPEPRAFFWGLRDLFQMALAAPVSPPSWLMPRSHYRTNCISQNIPRMQAFLDNTTSPTTTVFKLMTWTAIMPSFQLYYGGIVMGYIKWTGQFPEMNNIIDYFVTPILAMTDADNAYGWDRRLPVPEYSPVIDARLGAAATGEPELRSAVGPNPNTPETWAELWANSQLWFAAHRPSWTDPSTWPPNRSPNNNAYYPWVRGTLAMLSLAGYTAASANHDFVYNMMLYFNNYEGSGTRSWAIPP